MKLSTIATLTNETIDLKILKSWKGVITGMVEGVILKQAVSLQHE